ncbi:MAG: hypothetical protein JWN98_414 [Abditibacteriota bacterium]|nr:hypothetical protein [Abditibacteriota bacterium]
MTLRNRYLEAFKENFNVVGISGAVALSAALLNPLPLLVALVAEAAYLVFVPDSKWYEARLSARYDEEVRARREQLKRDILPQIRPVLQARFMRLEGLHADLARDAGQELWLREVIRKLDFLLEKFLQFAAKEAQFRTYLDSARQQVHSGEQIRSGQTAQHAKARDARNAAKWAALQKVGQSGAPASNISPSVEDRWVQEAIGEVQAHYDRELAEIKAAAENETDPQTKTLLDRRHDVLWKRREQIGKIGKILTNLNHQLELLEDTFGLISDEIRARPPEQVLADIEDVIFQTNTMTQLLDEVSGLDGWSPSRSSLSQAA